MFHDASVSVIEDGNILFAGHAERYSRVKNDPYLNKKLLADALKYGLPDVIVLHESSKLKNRRRIKQFTWSSIKSAFTEPTAEEWIRKFYPQLSGIPITNCLHHESHAAAGVLTSNFSDAAIMTIDAIGEFQTATIYRWTTDRSNVSKMELLTETNFPNSLGLFYSAITAKCGLKPMEDEYILMGMAAYGSPVYKDKLNKELFKHPDPHTKLLECLHTKVDLSKGLPKSMFPGEYDEQFYFDLAASAQAICEDRVLAYAKLAKQYTQSNNIVFMGGVALNCVANSKLYELFDNIHIMPNPGDAGSSLGAAALFYFLRTGKRVTWKNPYLGYNIKGKWPKEKFLDSLRKNEIFGVANGKAEFGPRALGNRSLFADPRGSDIKDRVNEIKRRQKFRPFAPIVLEEYARDWFEMPGDNISSPYMQFVAKCKKPHILPAIVHGDGTSRVQTVNRIQHPDLYDALTAWYKETGCPIVLNTSLNIKGQPIVNTEKDAEEFAKHYGVPVHVRDE